MPVPLSSYPSTTTKGQIEDMAFEEIGLAGYEFDATPAEQASGLRRLDSLMAMWAGPGMNLNLGYNAPTSIGGSARTDASGIPDLALDAVVIKLALAIAPGIGKSLSVETKTRMNESMRALRAAASFLPHVCYPITTPRGAGQKPLSTWRPFMGPCCWRDGVWGNFDGDDDGVSPRAIAYVVDGGGSVINTGVAGVLYLPFGFTIRNCTLLADQNGSVQIDIKTGTEANYPSDATSIVASDPPVIISAQKAQDNALTGWTTVIPTGNYLQFVVTSVTTITRLTIELGGVLT